LRTGRTKGVPIVGDDGSHAGQLLGAQAVGLILGVLGQLDPDLDTQAEISVGDLVELSIARELPQQLDLAPDGAAGSAVRDALRLVGFDVSRPERVDVVITEHGKDVVQATCVGIGRGWPHPNDRPL
jgi:hypothetical protein